MISFQNSYHQLDLLLIRYAYEALDIRQKLLQGYKSLQTFCFMCEKRDHTQFFTPNSMYVEGYTLFLTYSRIKVSLYKHNI